MNLSRFAAATRRTLQPARRLPLSPHAAPVRQPGAFRRACALALAGVGLQAAASAGTFYWTGDNDNVWKTTIGGTGTNWSSSGDFNNGTAGTPTASDDVFFYLPGVLSNLDTTLG